MPTFTITAKQDLCGGKIKKGQSFQIVTNYQTICAAAIADGLEKQLGGRWAPSTLCYWDVK